MQKYLPGETVVYSAKNELGKEFEFVLPEYLPGISRIVKLALGTEKCVFSATSPLPEMNISLRISIMYISEFFVGFGFVKAIPYLLATAGIGNGRNCAESANAKFLFGNYFKGNTFPALNRKHKFGAGEKIDFPIFF